MTRISKEALKERACKMVAEAIEALYAGVECHVQMEFGVDPGEPLILVAIKGSMGKGNRDLRQITAKPHRISNT